MVPLFYSHGVHDFPTGRFFNRSFARTRVTRSESTMIPWRCQKTGDDVATFAQANLYQPIIGKMLYIGRVSAPLILLHASMAATKLADLRCHYLCALASIIKSIQTQGAELHFLSPPSGASGTLVLGIIYDGASTTAFDRKGRGGFIIFRHFGDIVHLRQWPARRLHRVSRSTPLPKYSLLRTSCQMGFIYYSWTCNATCRLNSAPIRWRYYSSPLQWRNRKSVTTKSIWRQFERLTTMVSLAPYIGALCQNFSLTRWQRITHKPRTYWSTLYAPGSMHAPPKWSPTMVDLPFVVTKTRPKTRLTQ